MKNKKTKDTKVELEAWIVRNTRMLIELYGLGGITLNVGFRHTLSGKNENTVLFRMGYDTVYKTASLHYYPCTVEAYEKKAFPLLTSGLTHDIAHIMTEKLADLAAERYVSKREIEDETETLTETIAQLGRKLLDARNIKMV